MVFSISIQKNGPPLRTSDESSSADFHGGWTSDRDRCKAEVNLLGPRVWSTKNRQKKKPQVTDLHTLRHADRTHRLGHLGDNATSNLSRKVAYRFPATIHPLSVLIICRSPSMEVSTPA